MIRVEEERFVLYAKRAFYLLNIITYIDLLEQ